MTLESEKVIIQAPMSYVGSSKRLWKLTNINNQAAKMGLLVPLVVLLIFIAWCVISAWYLFFGIFLIPFRLIRRGSRKQKRDELRHREMLGAVKKSSQVRP